MERVTGIEPVWVAWKATARPLGHTRGTFSIVPTSCVSPRREAS